eukprot:m.85394 g.85394  ORF g.85394 m.85394 type:complete len:96 (-) comp12780_c0_seq1:1482-1769(-)
MAHVKTGEAVPAELQMLYSYDIWKAAQSELVDLKTSEQGHTVRRAVQPTPGSTTWHTCHNTMISCRVFTNACCTESISSKHRSVPPDDEKNQHQQ